MAGRRKPAAEVPPEYAHPDWQQLLDNAILLGGTTGDTYRRFHNYSTLNCAFLMMQGCPIEPIATFKGWQSVNRQVTKGASAFYIQRPIMVKTGEVNQKTGEEERRQLFKPVKSIFPISMTEGEPLPDVELPEWSKERALGALGIRQVAFESFESNRQGHSFGMNIAINPAAVFPEKTLFHELGHVVLGHTTGESYEEYLAHRGHRERCAESIAHIVTNELGLMTPEMAEVSRGYITSWGSDVRWNRTDTIAVFKGSDQILEAGRVPAEVTV